MFHLILDDLIEACDLADIMDKKEPDFYSFFLGNYIHILFSFTYFLTYCKEKTSLIVSLLSIRCSSLVYKLTLPPPDSIWNKSFDSLMNQVFGEFFRRNRLATAYLSLPAFKITY